MTWLNHIFIHSINSRYIDSNSSCCMFSFLFHCLWYSFFFSWDFSKRILILFSWRFMWVLIKIKIKKKLRNILWFSLQYSTTGCVLWKHHKYFLMFAWTHRQKASILIYSDLFLGVFHERIMKHRNKVSHSHRIW